RRRKGQSDPAERPDDDCEFHRTQASGRPAQAAWRLGRRTAPMHGTINAIPNTRVVVTGGAGYIGSHTVLALREQGWDVVVADNLSTGSRALVPKDVPLRVGDVGDTAFMTKLLADARPAAVVHFAASISVPESIANPMKYYLNNFANSCRLVDACLATGVDKLIFSSTAAVYGMPEQLPVTEAAVTAPINPYGRSKLMTEKMLRDVTAATGLRHVALRYFNVAGADLQGRAGQVVQNST